MLVRQVRRFLRLSWWMIEQGANMRCVESGVNRPYSLADP